MARLDHPHIVTLYGTYAPATGPAGYVMEYIDGEPLDQWLRRHPLPEKRAEGLAEVGGLMARGKIKHSYPHSWRSKAPIIYRNTPQWFAAIDKQMAVGDDEFTIRYLHVDAMDHVGLAKALLDVLKGDSCHRLFLAIDQATDK